MECKIAPYMSLSLLTSFFKKQRRGWYNYICGVCRKVSVVGVAFMGQKINQEARRSNFGNT